MEWKIISSAMHIEYLLTFCFLVSFPPQFLDSESCPDFAMVLDAGYKCGQRCGNLNEYLRCIFSQ